jgi:hypothetical protein
MKRLRKAHLRRRSAPRLHVGDSPKGMGSNSSEYNPCWIMDVHWKETRFCKQRENSVPARRAFWYVIVVEVACF